MTTAIATNVGCCPGLRLHDAGQKIKACSTHPVEVQVTDLDDGRGDVPFRVWGEVLHDHYTQGTEKCSVVSFNLAGQGYDIQVDAAVELGRALIAAAEAVRL